MDQPWLLYSQKHLVDHCLLATYDIWKDFTLSWVMHISERELGKSVPHFSKSISFKYEA